MNHEFIQWYFEYLSQVRTESPGFGSGNRIHITGYITLLSRDQFRGCISLLFMCVNLIQCIFYKYDIVFIFLFRFSMIMADFVLSRKVPGPGGRNGTDPDPKHSNHVLCISGFWQPRLFYQGRIYKNLQKSMKTW